MTPPCPSCSYSGKIFPQNIIFGPDRTKNIRCPKCRHVYPENGSGNAQGQMAVAAAAGVSAGAGAASPSSPSNQGTQPTGKGFAVACKEHPEAGATWRCEVCSHALCDRCVLTRNLGTTKTQVCKLCKGRCVGLTPEERGLSNPSGSKSLWGAFSYPFSGTGIVMLLFGGGFIWFQHLISRLFFIAVLAGLMVGGYIAAYMLKVISSSGDGEEELPHWPGISNLWDDIYRPFFLIIIPGGFCFAPVILHAIFSISMGVDVDELALDPLMWILLGLGILYYPMAMVAVAMFNTLAALNPMLIFPSIMKVFPQYMLACGILGGVMVLNIIANPLTQIPFVGGIMAALLSFYFLVVEMRILGLTYYNNKDRLEWF